MDLAMRRAFGLTKPAFDAEWRSRTMHRYGIIALVANVSLLFAILALLLFPLLWVRRRRNRRRLDALRAAESANDKAIIDEVQRLLGGEPSVRFQTDHDVNDH